ncbi:MAG: hypothetical protein R2713_12255 [Ilumatobacteraceae bacterium]
MLELTFPPQPIADDLVPGGGQPPAVACLANNGMVGYATVGTLDLQAGLGLSWSTKSQGRA